VALSDINQAMINAGASSGELLECGIQSICVVPLEELGNALMNSLTSEQFADWTDQEKTIVGNFLEHVYQQVLKEEN